MNPRITVVTPSYNQGQFLEETIVSVLSQREFIHEYFVVDGGSSDASVDIIHKYSKYIDWWVSESDGGQAHAISKGFRRATGEVISWINSDDVYLSGALQQVRAAFQERPDLDLLTGFMLFIDQDSTITDAFRVPAPSRALRRLGPVQVTQPTTFYKRALYQAVGGLDITLHCAMDRDLWARFYRSSPNWETLRQYIVGFRRHPDAKGKSPKWADMYRRETQIIDRRYPELTRPLFNKLGLFMYRVTQILMLRHVIAAADGFRLRGLPVGGFSSAPASGGKE